MYNIKPLESQIPGGRDSESQQSSLIQLIGWSSAPLYLVGAW